ncbi:MAG: LamG-like jellyroll fold domain-containing protein [Verrucomicrobiota bacterium]
MKLRHLLLLPLLAAPAAPAALTLVNFNGAPTTVTGPGVMSVFGGLTTSYGTVSGLGLTAMPGGNPTVMSFGAPGLTNTQGLSFTHASASPNTSGYTILMDVYYSTIPNYVSLLQMDNTGDGDLFGRGSGAIGISGNYSGAGFTANLWHRVAFTMDGTQTSMQMYIDGVLANGNTVPSAAARYNLSSPGFLLFADEDGETAAGYISQFAFADRVYSAAEIAGLGGASAPAVPEPAGMTLLGGVAALGLLSRRRKSPADS